MKINKISWKQIFFKIKGVQTRFSLAKTFFQGYLVKYFFLFKIRPLQEKLRPQISVNASNFDLWLIFSTKVSNFFHRCSEFDSSWGLIFFILESMPLGTGIEIDRLLSFVRNWSSYLKINHSLWYGGWSFLHVRNFIFHIVHHRGTLKIFKKGDNFC